MPLKVVLPRGGQTSLPPESDSPRIRQPAHPTCPPYFVHPVTPCFGMLWAPLSPLLWAPLSRLLWAPLSPPLWAPLSPLVLLWAGQWETFLLPGLVPGGRPFYHEHTCFFATEGARTKGQNSFLKSGIGSGRGIFESHAKYGLRIGIESGRSGSGARVGEGSGARVGK